MLELPIESKKKRWIVLTVIGLLIFIALFLSSKLTSNTSKTSDVRKTNVAKNCKSNPNPVFTAEFTDFDNLKQTAPIGSVIAGSPGRAYVMVKSDAMPTGAELKNRVMTPLYAPADATIISMVYAKRDPNNPNAPGEYRLELQISCEVTFNFDHVDKVVDKIKVLAPATPAEKSNEFTYVSIPVKAGELVGYTDGTPMAGSFDLFLLNTTKVVPHINPVRWKWDQVVNSDCPYEYYTDDLKTKYYSIMKTMDNQPLKNPGCGSPSHDIADSASGGWFQGESTDSTGKWLEIANYNGHAELLIRESGSHIFSIRDYNNKTLPDSLKVGQSTCYSEQGKYAWVKLDSNTQISLAKGETSCPTNFPTTEAETWHR